MASVDVHNNRHVQGLFPADDFAEGLRGHFIHHQHDSAHHPHHRRIPQLPDLRFEYSYLRNIRPYVRIERVPLGAEKGKEVAVTDDSIGRSVSQLSREVVHVQWGKVMWITVRDQVISPLVQGALWGVASHFLRPLAALLSQNFRAWWARGATYAPDSRRNEGHGVGWLRDWIASLTTRHTKLGVK